MRRVSSFSIRCLIFILWILPALVLCQETMNSETSMPWYIWFPLTIFSFIFSCLFRLLFSFWGWMIILFIVIPFAKDKLWMVNRRKSFLHSQKSALINPQDADARYQLGMIYLKGKSYKQAEHYLREATVITKDNSEYQFAFATALYRRKKYQEAISALQETLKINESTGYGDVQLRLGNCYLKLNNLQEARYWFEKAVEKNSSLAESYYKLALVCHRLGDKQKQRTMIDECRTIASNSPPFLRNRNRIWGIYASIYPVSTLFVR